MVLILSLKLTANAPENRPGPKRKFIFQPSIFRGELAVSLREDIWFKDTKETRPCWEVIFAKISQTKRRYHIGDPGTHTQLEELHPRKLTWISEMMGLGKGDSGFKYGHFWYVKFLGCHLGTRENYNDQPADLPFFLEK